jgi:hypothetical protein
MLEQIAEGIPTTGMLDTPIGRLEVSNGYPTEATTKKLFDEMDFQRAVQAYLWALPMIGSAQWQNEQHDKFGAGDLDYVDYLDFKDKLGLLTANATTPYSIAFINLAKTGPLVVEIPAGAIARGHSRRLAAPDHRHRRARAREIEGRQVPHPRAERSRHEA